MKWTVQGTWDGMKTLWRRAPRPPVTDHQRALDLIKAVDAGGIPLNPARVNAIARSLGLDVSTRAPVEQTIQRIRQALTRLGP